MRDLIFIIVTLILVWLAVYFAIPESGYSLQLWAIITCASISAVFAGLIVLLGEGIIEDIVKVGILVGLSAALGFTTPKIGFLLVCTIISGFAGIVMNHINQFVANKLSKSAP
jgi:hypothetical protein